MSADFIADGHYRREVMDGGKWAPTGQYWSLGDPMATTVSPGRSRITKLVNGEWEEVGECTSVEYSAQTRRKNSSEDWKIAYVCDTPKSVEKYLDFMAYEAYGFETRIMKHNVTRWKTY